MRILLIAGSFGLLVAACTSTQTGSYGGSTAPMTLGANQMVAGEQADTGVVGEADTGQPEPAPGAPDTDGGPFCTVPLSPDAGPATLDDVPIAAWCASQPNFISEWTTPCGGYMAIIVASGVDCDTQYVFDATSRRLVAITTGCNGKERCVEGDSSFAAPMDTDPDAGYFDTWCLYAHASTRLCAVDGGVADSPASD
jgi:hypothetical protein